MKLTATLNLIRARSSCGLTPQPGGTLEGYLKLSAYLGSGFDQDADINLLTILDSNGVQDMLWCLRAAKEGGKLVVSQLAIGFAEQALPTFEARHPDDKRPRLAIQAARDFDAGLISVDDLRLARCAAVVDAVICAAYAADRKVVVEKQDDIIRMILS